MIKTVRYEREFSLECACQASKVFERGGPFKDLLMVKSIDAKRDPRLNQHGWLIKLQFFGTDWPLEPRTAFYDGLYINALHKRPVLAEVVLTYHAFSDIAFNPERFINCQAYAAAPHVSLHARGLLTDRGLRDRDESLNVISTGAVNNAHENTIRNHPLRFEQLSCAAPHLRGRGSAHWPRRHRDRDGVVTALILSPRTRPVPTSS